jgi:GNAT superfamily N-acetyltransferase
MNERIRSIETCALNAWPAADDTWVGKWLVRRDRGYTKRANCIYAFPGEPDLDIDQRLTECESLMTRAQLPVIVRELSTFPVPGLAETLTDGGMSVFDGSLVMTRDIGEGGTASSVQDVDLSEWLELYLKFEGGTKGNQAVHREILARISAAKRYAVLKQDDRPVSIGLAVAENGWLGLFDIATDPGQRGRGFGTAMIDGLLNWGASVGCTCSYLQVMAGNVTAQRLYSRLGFAEEYRYHYWAVR